ncbi:MAG: MFS transporter [Labedaea sp.]
MLGVAEFRALLGAELLSILGDQLARVALALLVFRQTSSAALSALTYALTFAPAVLGGVLLSGFADRYPRRRVLVVTDLLRAGLAATMAIPALPLPALWVLVGLMSMSAAPFKAAQLAVLPQVLPGDRYLVGLSLRQITGQSAQLLGFATGGLLLAAVEPHIALVANAMTFVISAALILIGVRRRPRPSAGEADAPPRETAAGIRKSQLVPLIALVCVVGVFAVPEGVAAPYGTTLGAGSIGIGLLMAADPLGSVIGGWLTGRFLPRASPVVVIILAAVSGVPLIMCAAGPGLLASIVLWTVSGALSTAYLIHALAALPALVPDHRRGRVMGWTATCLYTSQGLAIVAGGIAAQVVGPFRAVASAGLLGTVLALCVGGWWRSVARSRRDLAAGSERSSNSERSPQMSLVTTDTSSWAADPHDAAGEDTGETETPHQMSFVTINTSSQVQDPSAVEQTSEFQTSHQMSFVTINTSSRTQDPRHSTVEQISESLASHQMSFVTVNTSSRTQDPHHPTVEQISEIETSHQMSFVTSDTSSRSRVPSGTATEHTGETETSHQMSLVTTNTSSGVDDLHDTATEHSGKTDGSHQMSLVTTDTSSRGSCLDAATGPFLARRRRPGTQAPSLWAHRLSSAVGRLLVGRVACG